MTLCKPRAVKGETFNLSGVPAGYLHPVPRGER